MIAVCAFCAPGALFVSIHALAWGRLNSVTQSPLTSKRFNPRPRVGQCHKVTRKHDKNQGDRQLGQTYVSAPEVLARTGAVRFSVARTHTWRRPYGIVNVRKNRTFGAVWTARLVLRDLGRYAQPMSQKL